MDRSAPRPSRPWRVPPRRGRGLLPARSWRFLTHARSRLLPPDVRPTRLTTEANFGAAFAQFVDHRVHRITYRAMNGRAQGCPLFTLFRNDADENNSAGAGAGELRERQRLGQSGIVRAYSRAE